MPTATLRVVGRDHEWDAERPTRPPHAERGYEGSRQPRSPGDSLAKDADPRSDRRNGLEDQRHVVEAILGMVGDIPVLTHPDRHPQVRRKRARRSLGYPERRQSADGSESPRKSDVTPEFEDERHGRPDDPLGTMCLSSSSSRGEVSPIPGSRRDHGEMICRAEERGCSEIKVAPNGTSRAEESETPNDAKAPADRSQEHRPKPSASSEANGADRSQLVDRSHWHRDNCVAPSEANRAERSRPRSRARPRSRQPGGTASY